MDPAGSGEHSRDGRLLNTTAGVRLTVLLVLSFGCVLQQRIALAPKLSIEGDVDTVAITAHFMDDGDVKNEIGFPGNEKALNIDVATLPGKTISSDSSALSCAGAFLPRLLRPHRCRYLAEHA